MSVLMSSSMARTAPARASRLARSVMLSSGPADVDERTVGRHPETGSPDVDRVAERGAPLRGVGGVQAGNRLPIVDQEVQVLADRDDVRRHGDVATPLADRRRAVPVDDERGRAGAQRHDHPAVGVVAAVGGRHQEPGVERGDQAARRRRAESARCGVRTAAGDLAARVQAWP